MYIQDGGPCPSPGPPVRDACAHFPLLSPNPSCPRAPAMATAPNDAAAAAIPVAIAARSAAPKKKKPKEELTPEQIARESVKRAGRRARDAEKKAKAHAALEAAAAQHKATVEGNDVLVAKATQAATLKALMLLGFNQPTPVVLSAATMAAASTCSSAVRPPQGQSPSSSTTPQTVGPMRPATMVRPASPCRRRAARSRRPHPFPRPSSTSMSRLGPAPPSRPPGRKRSGHGKFLRPTFPTPASCSTKSPSRRRRLTRPTTTSSWRSYTSLCLASSETDRPVA